MLAILQQIHHGLLLLLGRLAEVACCVIRVKLDGRDICSMDAGKRSCLNTLRLLTLAFFLLSSSSYRNNKHLPKMAESRKPNKLYATHPKGYGKGSRACRVTGREGGMGLIRKYGINMKRQVFRERAIDMGWNKYN